MTELQMMRATDKLVSDERQELIGRSLHRADVLDDRNFKLEWADEDLTTGYILRGCVARASALMTYSFTHQQLGRQSSRLRFNEGAAYIGIIDGPLKLETLDMTYGQEQMYLGTIIRRALNSLILDRYNSVSTDGTL